MLFNSASFLFIFLPLAAGLFHWLAHRGEFRLAMLSLTIFSLFFYGFWNPAYLPLLVFSIGVNYLLGQLLFRQPARWLLVLGIVFNLSLIAYFKYAHFFVSVAASVSGEAWLLHQVVLPLGISFFTFQQITWLVDTYRGQARQQGFIDYALFVSFFPQLIAGPIVHHHEMMPQFKRQSVAIADNFTIGLTFLFIGLFKKVIIADSLAMHATPVFDAAGTGVTLTLLEAWTGALAYSLQLYFDFSGYSDMAIGIARLFGITLPMNFNSPYKATSIIDFWRRWHMTLSRFLRDYVYIPLGGNKHGAPRRYLNLGLTMLLGGLWHGAGWTFIVWGALHGAFLMINQLWRHLTGYRDHIEPVSQHSRQHSARHPGRRAASLLGNLSARLLTLLCVTCAWVVFRAVDMDAALSQLRSMAGLNGIALPEELARLTPGVLQSMPLLPVSFGSVLGNELFAPASAAAWIVAAGAVAFLFPNTQQFMHRYQPVLEAMTAVDAPARYLQWSPTWFWNLALSTLTLYTLLHLSRVSEFLYFQF